MCKINKIIKCFGIVLGIIVVLMFFLTIAVNNKGSKVNDKINEFKSRSIYVGTYTLDIEEKQTNSYYKVTREHDYEINDGKRIFSTSNTQDETQIFTDIYVGDVGDIYLSTSNPFSLLYTEWMSKKIYIGHAGIISNENATKIFESTGKGNNKGVHELDNDWYNFKTDGLILIRNKNTINKKEIQNWLLDKENNKYNYLYFIKANNRYYCTDLVTRCYEESNDINISNNNTFVTGESIINNDENYIIYYREKSNEENIDYNVYFLE